MRQRGSHFHVGDTTLLGGWLFADLLLALMVIFLAAAPGASHPLPPALAVTPTSLDQNSPLCKNIQNLYQCTITLGEVASSKGLVNWAATSDINQTIQFLPAKGTLSPGHSMSITISAIPCQNGSFTFAGSIPQIIPVTILWHCVPPPDRLEDTYIHIVLNNVDFIGLLSDSPQASEDIRQRVQNQPQLQGRSVGLTIIYGGAPTDADIPQANNIADKVRNILKSLGQQGIEFEKSSYYNDLYGLGTLPTTVVIDAYLFKQ